MFQHWSNPVQSPVGRIPSRNDEIITLTSHATVLGHILWCKEVECPAEPDFLSASRSSAEHLGSHLVNHLKPIFCVDCLVILTGKHITEMLDSRIMYDRNLVPPLFFRSIHVFSGICFAMRRFDHVAHYLRITSSLACYLDKFLRR